MELKAQLQKALQELRKEKKRKFNQTVDLIINLQKFNVKKSSINLVIALPYKVKEKRIGAFLEVDNKNVPTITGDKFKKYNNKNELRKLVNQFDFFIAQASLMPKVATTFGKVLGPIGKMPSPQLGIIMNADDKTIETLKKKINSSIKIKVKEPSIKLAVGKYDMDDKDIIENILTTYNSILKELPRDKENIKNIELKFTMTKPQKIILK